MLVWRGVLLPILLALIGGAATICAKIFADDFASQPIVVQISSFVLAGVTLANAVLAAWNGVTAIREKRISNTYVCLLAALTKIVGLTQVPAGELGMSAYRVRRVYW